MNVAQQILVGTIPVSVLLLGIFIKSFFDSSTINTLLRDILLRLTNVENRVGGIEKELGKINGRLKTLEDRAHIVYQE
jgi:hypothetical protein